MAVAFRSAGTALGSFAGSLTLTYTATAGDNLYCGIYCTDNVNPSSVSSDLDGAFTVDVDTGTSARAVLYKLANATGGLHTVTVSWAAGPGACAGVVWGMSGGDTTTPTDNATANSATGTAATITITSATGDLAMAFGITTGSAEVYTPTNGTVHSDQVATNATWCRTLVMSIAGGASVTIDGTYAASDPWRWVGANLNVAAAAGGGIPRSPLNKPFTGPLGGAV